MSTNERMAKLEEMDNRNTRIEPTLDYVNGKTAEIMWENRKIMIENAKLQKPAREENRNARKRDSKEEYMDYKKRQTRIECKLKVNWRKVCVK